MAAATRIIMIIISILQFLFPFFEYEGDLLPTEPGESITQEVTTEQETTTLPAVCKHIGGDATCTSKATCIRCGEEYGKFAPHTYTVNIKKNTCLEDGYSTYTCTVCSYSYTGDETKATGHNYTGNGKEPTCTETGYYAYTCLNCGGRYFVDEVPALGHEYTEEYINPTCEEAGHIKYTCTRCNDVYTEEKEPATGHNYTSVITAPTCKLGGYTTHTCDKCGSSYTSDETAALGHSFTNYIPDGNATCKSDGTKTAYCDNGCGLISTYIDTGSKLAHTDNNKDKHCDIGGEELFIEFTHLTYPSQAVKVAEDWGISLNTLISRGDPGDDIYASNQGYSDCNGIVISPYYTAKVEGTSVPVYGAVTYNGTSGKGVLHSFSEIYIEKDEYCTFEIEISSAGINITDAIVLPEAYGEKVVVADGKATAILSGFGAHTFLFNGEDQNYAYTVFVREEVDDDAEIAALREQGYTVYEVDGFLPYDYTVFSGPSVAKSVIYLRKGSYVTANHLFEINSDADNSSKNETLADGTSASAHNGIGLNRMPFINAHNTSDIKVLGYGVIDLTHLDRAERRGVVFSFSNNVEVRGIRIVNSPEWSFITYRCNNVTIKDVSIFGYRTNSDAFDICNSTNVNIDGCFARSGDDLFAVKALGGDENAIANNITFTNCYAWAAKARAFGLFGESNRSVSDVTFRDCYVIMHDATWDYDRIPAIGIVAETADPNNGTITFRNINFENIEISRHKAAAANVLVFSQITNNFIIDNVNFRNVTYKSNNVLNRIDKYGANSSISNITFENTTCGTTKVVDSNKTSYFSEESYWGGYITVK